MPRITIGIDEVGRGALAGPVVVVAAALIGSPRDIARMTAGRRKDNGQKLGTLKDSKKLSAAKREQWCDYFATQANILFAVARVYPREIEKRNISGAANLAALRAYNKLIKNIAYNRTSVPRHETFLDGGLFLGDKHKRGDGKTIVKADEKIPAVAIASIIAKVHRDKFMIKLAKKYPDYGFDVHKGYGTKIHYAALARTGSCLAHRRSFVGAA